MKETMLVKMEKAIKRMDTLAKLMDTEKDLIQKNASNIEFVEERLESYKHYFERRETVRSELHELVDGL